MNRTIKYSIFFSLVIITTACATYYQKSLKFQEFIQSGEFEKAQKFLDKDEKAPKGKNKLLYYLNRGWVSWIQNDFQNSNQFFEQADHIIEDYHKSIGLEALTLISNPSIKPYKAEDFEVVLVNYFKALNYLSLNNYEAALVECKRINIRLHELNDKYKDHKNRYQDDAFAHIIMGLIYEAGNDYNNAFIAYRNAYEVYEKSYVENFDIKIPHQLKQDILRTAAYSGFYSEVDYYEKKFNLKYQREQNEGGDMVVFWHNGFGPVKSEWSINFTKVDSEGGYITFANEEYGMNFPIYIGDKSDDEKSAFGEISLMRVAFPKYLERKPIFKTAKIQIGGKEYKLEKAQDLNAIAFKTLNDRMVREMANSMLRLATKKALEIAARKNKQDELGSAISIVSALTEKADTRNWQSLPYEIHYVRIPMPEGKHNLSFVTSNNRTSQNKNIEVNINKGKIKFITLTSLESFQLQERTK